VRQKPFDEGVGRQRGSPREMSPCYLASDPLFPIALPGAGATRFRSPVLRRIQTIPLSLLNTV
jgi:hypothetical protein